MQANTQKYTVLLGFIDKNMTKTSKNRGNL